MKIHGENINRVSGVYIFLHRDSGRCYVGSSVDMGQRLTRHLWDIDHAKQTYFGRALKKYGFEAFDYEVIVRCPKEQLLEREKFFIQFYGAVAPGGFNTYNDPTATYDKKVSEATRAKIRAKKIGKKLTEEHRRKISEANRGRKFGEEFCRKQSLRMMGYIPSLETREKLRVANLNWRVNDEQRAKLKASQIARRQREREERVKNSSAVVSASPILPVGA